MLRRLQEGLAWRYRRARRLRFLRASFRNGDELVRSYLDNTSCDTAVCRDGTVVEHPAGRTGLAGMILEVWLDEVYTGAFYTPRPGHVVVDAGANIGLLSLLIARTAPGCRVLAFEPFAENYRVLERNLAAARASAVQPFRLALAGTRGEAVMVEGGARSQDHKLQPRPGDASGPATETRSFGDVLAMAAVDVVDLFKCDIEGSEYDLFAGATPDELRRVRQYAIEYHEHLRPGTLDFLRQRLTATHHVVVEPAPGGGYGMLYATIRSA